MDKYIYNYNKVTTMKIINNLIIIITLIISLFTQKILLTILLLPILLISLLIRKYNKNLELVYLIFIFLSYVLGYTFDYYDKVYYFDAIMHSMFGVVSSIFSLPLLKKLNKYNTNAIVFNIFFIIIFTLAMASVWEIIEFTIDKLFNANMQRGLNNTMKDIISALLSSFLYCLFYLDNNKLIEKLFIVRN